MTTDTPTTTTGTTAGTTVGTAATVHRAAVVLTSTGPAYADQWHDLPTTSALVARVLADAGLEVQVRDDVVDALEEHAGRALLVVACSAAQEVPDQERADAERVGAALRRHTEAGAGVLAVHSGAMAFPAVPEWSRLLGARWVHGRSGHPDLDRCTIQVADAAHPVTAGLDDFAVEDERYSDLEIAADRLGVVTHEHDGRTHPLVLVGTAGRSRVAYDALGHDARSYASPQRRELLGRAARWAAGLPPVA